MSVIAGLADGRDQAASSASCRDMLARLERLGGERDTVRWLDGWAFGHGLRSWVPEDAFSDGPIASATSLFVADGRLDNRNEVAAALGWPSARLADSCDEALLHAAWRQWGASGLPRLVGDFVLADWDSEGRCLTLARSPLAHRGLFYHRAARCTAFASLPQAIRALPGVPRGLDHHAASLLAAGNPSASDATLFAGIRAVRQGHAVTLSPAGERHWRFWSLDDRPPPRSLAEAGEGLRFELGRAVEARLRRCARPVAAQLSSGRDSSAVVAIAAERLAGEGASLLALTHAPRLGFADGTDREWLSDESALAASVAALHPNVAHRVLRPQGVAIADQFDAAHRDCPAPLGNASNVEWVLHTVREARAAGAPVLLTGALGNFSVSRGGILALSDLRRQSGAIDHVRLLHALHRGGLPWRTLANLTFGPAVPRLLYDAARRLARRDPGVGDAMVHLRGPFRASVEAAAGAGFADPRPWRDFREHLRDHLYTMESGVFAGLAQGVELRDPTADVRLVQFCHSLAPGHLLSADSPRPAYAAAFAGLVPPAVIAGARRGFQGADWFETFAPDALRAAFRRYARHPIVAELIDLAAIEAQLDRWPTAGGWRMDNIILFGQRLLNTLAMASFIAVNFDD